MQAAKDNATWIWHNNSEHEHTTIELCHKEMFKFLRFNITMYIKLMKDIHLRKMPTLTSKRVLWSVCKIALLWYKTSCQLKLQFTVPA